MSDKARVWLKLLSLVGVAAALATAATERNPRAAIMAIHMAIEHLAEASGRSTLTAEWREAAQ